MSVISLTGVTAGASTVVIPNWRRDILRGKIIRKYQGNLSALVQNFNFKEIIPSANSVEESKAYVKKLYGTTDGIFTAYKFALSR